MRKNFTAPPGPGSCLLNCRVGKHPLPTLRTRNAIVDARGRELRCDPRRPPGAAGRGGNRGGGFGDPAAVLLPNVRAKPL